MIARLHKTWESGWWETRKALREHLFMMDVLKESLGLSYPSKPTIIPSQVKLLRLSWTTAATAKWKPKKSCTIIYNYNIMSTKTVREIKQLNWGRQKPWVHSLNLWELVTVAKNREIEIAASETLRLQLKSWDSRQICEGTREVSERLDSLGSADWSDSSGSPHLGQIDLMHVTILKAQIQAHHMHVIKIYITQS